MWFGLHGIEYVGMRALQWWSISDIWLQRPNVMWCLCDVYVVEFTADGSLPHFQPGHTKCAIQWSTPLRSISVCWWLWVPSGALRSSVALNLRMIFWRKVILLLITMSNMSWLVFHLLKYRVMYLELIALDHQRPYFLREFDHIFSMYSPLATLHSLIS